MARANAGGAYAASIPARPAFTLYAAAAAAAWRHIKRRSIGSGICANKRDKTGGDICGSKRRRSRNLCVAARAEIK